MKNDTHKCGVYAIRNLINGKVYIGSTIVSFKKRWASHKRKLKNNKHGNQHLQNAYNKYGNDNFEYQIIEITTPEMARQKESYYIKFFKSSNSKYGYNISDVDVFGNNVVSEGTRKKLSIIAKQQWLDGKHSNERFRGKPSWNKGLKCDNISLARRNMFSSIEVYKDGNLIATFRSVTDLSEWTKYNQLPGLTYYSDKKNRSNLGTRTTYLQCQNIHRAVRNKSIYRGLIFKKGLPLSPEMGIVKWENCWKGEIPNQQPSQPLTKLEGSETND